MTIPPPERPGDGPSDDDIDAEFARMMEGLDVPEVPEDTADPSARPADPAAGLADPDRELTVEDVLGAPSAASDPDAPVPLAVVATSVASAKALAGALRLAGEPSDLGAITVHGTDSGAIVVGDLDEPGAHDVAARVSAALQRLGVVLFWRRGDRMTATRYRAGERGDDVSPALVLGGVGSAVEQLLLGALDRTELDEGIDPAAVSRMQALRWLATGRGRS